MMKGCIFVVFVILAVLQVVGTQPNEGNTGGKCSKSTSNEAGKGQCEAISRDVSAIHAFCNILTILKDNNELLRMLGVGAATNNETASDTRAYTINSANIERSNSTSDDPNNSNNSSSTRAISNNSNGDNTNGANPNDTNSDNINDATPNNPNSVNINGANPNNPNSDNTNGASPNNPNSDNTNGANPNNPNSNNIKPSNINGLNPNNPNSNNTKPSNTNGANPNNPNSDNINGATPNNPNSDNTKPSNPNGANPNNPNSDNTNGANTNNSNSSNIDHCSCDHSKKGCIKINICCNNSCAPCGSCVPIQVRFKNNATGKTSTCCFRLCIDCCSGCQGGPCYQSCWSVSCSDETCDCGEQTCYYRCPWCSNDTSMSQDSSSSNSTRNSTNCDCSPSYEDSSPSTSDCCYTSSNNSDSGEQNNRPWCRPHMKCHPCNRRRSSFPCRSVCNSPFPRCQQYTQEQRFSQPRYPYVQQQANLNKCKRYFRAPYSKNGMSTRTVQSRVFPMKLLLDNC